MDTLLKSGEFAQLCCTTKETLRHYAKIGLLTPSMQAQNGYNYYSFTQFADFSLISALQSTGLSLNEIRKYLTHPSRASLHVLLEERIASIDTQINDLQRKQQVLKGALDQTQQLDSWFDDSIKTSPEGYRWRIVTCPEEYYLETSMPYTQGKEDDFIRSVIEYVKHCEVQGLTPVFQEAYRIDEAHTISRNYAEGLCAEEHISKRIESARLRVKPAGRYLQWLNRIDLGSSVGDQRKKLEQGEDDFSSLEDNPMFVAYDALQDFAEREGITLVGDLYDVVLSLYGGSFTEAIYTEVSRRIR